MKFLLSKLAWQARFCSPSEKVMGKMLRGKCSNAFFRGTSRRGLGMKTVVTSVGSTADTVWDVRLSGSRYLIYWLIFYSSWKAIKTQKIQKVRPTLRLCLAAYAHITRILRSRGRFLLFVVHSTKRLEIAVADHASSPRFPTWGTSTPWWYQRTPQGVPEKFLRQFKKVVLYNNQRVIQTSLPTVPTIHGFWSRSWPLSTVTCPM